MKEIDEEKLRKYAREFKDEFGEPSANHEEKFMAKLQSRVKKFIDLTPYFVKVAIVTIIVFLCSIFAWYSFMRPDPSKTVIENIIEQFKK
jgi:uncharacterized membrane protein (DUF106 family)